MSGGLREGGNAAHLHRDNLTATDELDIRDRLAMTFELRKRLLWVTKIHHMDAVVWRKATH